MAAQILVALKSEDRLSQMIPYIEKIAQPGMRVVLLVRFIPQPAAKPVGYDLMEPESPEQSQSWEGEPKKLRCTEKAIKGTQVEEQALLAERKVFLALEGLLRRGIEITVDVYTGSLRRAVKRYTRTGNVHFIMKRLGKVHAMMQLVRMTLPNFRWFRERNFTPVLLQQLQMRGA